MECAGRSAHTRAWSPEVNFLATRKREHSRKPDEIYPIIEACSPGPFIELFARAGRDDEAIPYQQLWTRLGDEAANYLPWSENPVVEIQEVVR